MKILRLAFFLFIAQWGISGCVATARISDLPAAAENIDFGKAAVSKITETDKGWNRRTRFEYYLKTNNTDAEQIAVVIKSSLAKDNFRIVSYDAGKAYVLGERPGRANEWKSVIGVYYKAGAAGHEIYILAKITQDFTGGWAEDRAKKVADDICSSLKDCSESYSVRLE